MNHVIASSVEPVLTTFASNNPMIAGVAYLEVRSKLLTHLERQKCVRQHGKN